MSCGHCQLKIRSELESNNFDVINIDMEKSTVQINASTNDVSRIVQILDHINYVIDLSLPISDTLEYTIWSDKLEDDKLYEQFIQELDLNEFPMVGFDEENIGVIISCTKEQYDQMMQYLEEL